MATDYLGRELPEQAPIAQTVEEFAVERGNLQAEDLTTEEQETGKDSTPE
jgi:hypothetical protein